MTDEATTITRMKRYYASRMFEFNVDSFFAEVMAGNDRSCIITVSALIDTSLEWLLASNLSAFKKASEKDYNNGFRHNGPLGTFSAKIELALMMGLIDRNLGDQLTDLRHIRNSVAHTFRRVTFDDPILRAAVVRLFHPKGAYRLLSEDSEGYRRTFVAEGHLLSYSLCVGRETAIAHAREAFVAKGKTCPF